MKSFEKGQSWWVFYTSMSSGRLGVVKESFYAKDIQGALTRAKKHLPLDAQVVRIELKQYQRG